MELYRIDWNKYLSAERSRQSSYSKGANVLDERIAFESDFGRAVFSSASRRMHDKTQVMPLNSDDNVHSRLTHSLEVMSIAQSLGDNLCRNENFKKLYGDDSFELERKISAILRTVAIMHDIGNPPFGHFGEYVISKYFTKMLCEKTNINEFDFKNIDIQNEHDLNNQQLLDFVQFDGNAQGLRVLTKLQYLDDLNGLNLTFATLGAYLKYPNKGNSDKTYIGTKKHGIYFSENEIFDKIVNACNLRMIDKDGKERIKRHPLSFLVEAADTICYRTMDIEDGFSLGWYSFKDMIKKINFEINTLNPDENYDICSIIGYKNFDSNEEPNRKKMVDFRVKLIQYFVNLATKNYIQNLENIDNGSYSCELLDQDDYKVEEALKNFNVKYIFTNREIQYAELTGSSVITGLLDILINFYFSSDMLIRAHARSITSKTILRTSIHEQFGNIPDSIDDINCFDVAKLNAYQKFRIIVDFVSGMTDQYTVKLYQRLSGQKL